MARRRSGANPVLSGVLERPTPHSSPVAIGPEGLEGPVGRSGRRRAVRRRHGAGGRHRGDQQAGDGRTARRIRGRTIYLPDDLFERILVQAHRRDRTISEYVAGILERQVPDHRIARAEPTNS